MCAAVAGFSGVALDAFAAHGLKARLAPALLPVFETAVRYQIYHALALFAVAWAWARWRHRAIVPPECCSSPASCSSAEAFTCAR